MKRGYEDYIIYSLLGLVALVLLFTVYSSLGTKGAAPQGISINSRGGEGGGLFEPIGSGSTGTGDVAVELTPYDTSNKQLKVKIAANTHSVDLSQFDLKQITSLEYGGISVRPVSAPRLTGHHSNGELVFNIEKELSSFTIRISGIPKVGDRVFSWQT